MRWGRIRQACRAGVGVGRHDGCDTAAGRPCEREGGTMLHLHRADRSDALVGALAEVLADPLLDPLAFDVVAVPARGIERWITQQLSHRLGRTDTEAGVCAGVRFPSPAGLIAEVVGGREADPWTPDRLAWPVLSAIDASLTEPWAAILARYLGADDAGTVGSRPGGRERADRRYAVA